MKTSRFFFLGLLTIITPIDAMRARVAQRYGQKFVLGMFGVTASNNQPNSWAPTAAQLPTSRSLNSGTFSIPAQAVRLPAPVNSSSGKIVATPVHMSTPTSTVTRPLSIPMSGGRLCVKGQDTAAISIEDKANDKLSLQQRKQQMDLILTGASTYPDRYHNPNAWRGGPRDLPDTKDRLFEGVDGGILGEQGPIRRNLPYSTSESSGSFCTIQ